MKLQYYYTTMSGSALWAVDFHSGAVSIHALLIRVRDKLQAFYVFFEMRRNIKSNSSVYEQCFD